MMNIHSQNSHFLVALSSVLLLLVIAMVGCSGSSDSATAVAEEALWCNEHGVEEKYCVLCHPEIREGDLLLCPAHGNIPEAICTACHPELKEKYESCPHDLPPAFCAQCSAEFAAFLEEGNSPSEGHQDHEHEGDDHA